ncbi:MAG: PorP/SprF family type IX secretion system membrane protein [Campylobacteraceae bacterium]|nr:PorP/SprF family type IX secretion system membrane protein [Campylobacteraceae bacterium]
MKKKVFILLPAIFSLLNIIPVKSQDIHFTQYEMTPLILNPSNAGSEYEIRGILNYRSQWSMYSTAMASYDMQIGKTDKGYWSGGLFFFNDKVSETHYKENHINISGAYHLYLNQKLALGVGFGVGYFQKSVSVSSLAWGYQYDGYSYNSSLPSNENISNDQSSGNLGLSSGVNVTYRKGDKKYMTSNDQIRINGGIGIQHVNQPELWNYTLTEKMFRRYTLHANSLFGIPNTRISIAPGFIATKQGPHYEFVGGSFIVYKIKDGSKDTKFIKEQALGLGVFVRNTNSVNIATFIETGNIKFCLSYDYTMSISGIETVNNGAFELSLQYVFPPVFGGSPLRLL